MAVTPTNWSRLKEIVADAIDAPADERDALIAAACDHDEELASEAHKLIEAYGDVDGVILNRDTDGWLGIGGPDVLSLGGQRIGRYRLVRVLGEGAMSAVYLARQANPDRDVAVKLLRTALPLVDARGRFRREATALARLRHPNIAVIYEAGLHDTADNRAIPYIAMEYVDGVPLTDYCNGRKLDRNARIALLIEVARAVQHAHQQTIIHRDLKPANVLVDDNGTPKVLDFGIARIATVDSDRATWQTTAGLLLGTPGYMSPEQCSPDSGDHVDVRSDVWSLGVMLYELLLGRLPIEAKGGSIADIMRRLETSEPIAPHVIDPGLRGDLSTILMTAVCRDKERRYASAQALADDLGRYLKQLPIEAHPPTTFYLASKFVRRHRGVIAAAVATALALLGSTLLSSAGFYNARMERDRANEALKHSIASEQNARASEQAAQVAKDLAQSSEKRAQAVRDFLMEIIGSPDPMTGKHDVTVLDMLRQNERHLATRFQNEPGIAAELFSTVGWTYFNLSDYEGAERNLRKAVERATEAKGATDVLTIDARCRLITILRWENKEEEARKLCDSALADAIRVLGSEHESTYPLMDNDAGISEDIGDHATAITKYEKLYALGKRLTGDANDQTLTAGNNLGLSLQNAGQYNKSIVVLREVIAAGDKMSGGPNSMRAMIPRHNLATALSNLERLPEAIEIQREVVATAEANLPEGHNNLRSAWRSLGDFLRQAGEYDEAMSYLRRATAASLKTAGRSHPSTIRDITAETAVLCESGHLDEGIALARKTIAECVADGVGDEPAVWDLRVNLAAALNDTPDAAEAQREGEACLAYLRKEDGPDSNRTLTVACNYAGALIGVGRVAEAEQLVRDSMKLTSDEQPLMQASLHRMLGRTLIADARYAEAKSELDIAWNFVSTLPSPHHRRRVMDQYISLYEKTGDEPNHKLWSDRRAALVYTSQSTTQPATRPATTQPS